MRDNAVEKCELGMVVEKLMWMGCRTWEIVGDRGRIVVAVPSYNPYHATNH